LPASAGGSLASRVSSARPRRASTRSSKQEPVQGWPGSPEFQPDCGPQHVLKGASINADATSEYLGVGYIIGPKVAGVIFAGGVLSWLVIMRLIYFFWQRAWAPVYPGQVPIAQMSPSDLWATYIKPMGAGAVAAAGLITLFKTLPTIVSALTSGIKDHASGRRGRAGQNRSAPKTTCPWASWLIGSLLIVACMFVFLEFRPVPGAFVGLGRKPGRIAAGGGLWILFVTVSSRIVGPGRFLGQPRFSGMTIATLMATLRRLLVMGWTLRPTAHSPSPSAASSASPRPTRAIRRRISNRLHHRSHAAPCSRSRS